VRQQLGDDLDRHPAAARHRGVCRVDRVRRRLRVLDGAASGWCDPKVKRIVVDASLPANAQVRVLVYELAHALGIDYREFGRERAEVIVDTVAFVVCGSVGLDVSGEGAMCCPSTLDSIVAGQTWVVDGGCV
jgi:hypothetical protein